MRKKCKFSCLGFLPSFGPSYVNFYGSQREWELWQSTTSEQKNLGTEEGVAFRGRVLVCLKTSVGAYPSSPLTNMDAMDFERIRVSNVVHFFPVSFAPILEYS